MGTEWIGTFLSNLGFFGPAAAIMWWVIKTQREDLKDERDKARGETAALQARNEKLTERLLAIAEGDGKTMASIAEALKALG
jgi:hypothetical protein